MKTDTTQKEWQDWKKTELLALPHRQESETTYDSVLIVPTREKHDSGFARIAIIGVRERVPVEITAYPDDINWFASQPPEGIASFRTDASMHGILHVWGRGTFKVGDAFSSTDIHFTRTRRL